MNNHTFANKPMFFIYIQQDKWNNPWRTIPESSLYLKVLESWKLGKYLQVEINLT
jgi:hypothetical protein